MIQCCMHARAVRQHVHVDVAAVERQRGSTSHRSEEKMATCVGYETETDNSSSEIADRPTSASNATMDVIKTVGVVMYKIPSFSVLSFELKQVVCSVWDDAHDRVQHFDIFMRSSPDIDSQVPCTVEILESCTIPVS